MEVRLCPLEGVRLARGVGGGTWYKYPRTLVLPDLDICLAERLWEVGVAA